MAKTAKVLSFEREGGEESVKVDPGGGANATARHVAPPGVDAPPLPGDYAEIDESSGKGTKRIVGYYDHRNTRLAEGGEFRVYGRDSDGEVVCSFWLKSDGTIVTQIGDYTQTLTAAGAVRSTFTDVELIDGAGRSLVGVGDFVVVVIPALVAGTYPVVPAVGAPRPDFKIAAAGQIVSGISGLKG